MCTSGGLNVERSKYGTSSIPTRFQGMLLVSFLDL